MYDLKLEIFPQYFACNFPHYSDEGGGGVIHVSKIKPPIPKKYNANQKRVENTASNYAHYKEQNEITVYLGAGVIKLRPSRTNFIRPTYKKKKVKYVNNI